MERWTYEVIPGTWTYSQLPERLIMEANKYPLGSEKRRKLISEATRVSLIHAKQMAEDICNKK